MQLEFEWVLPKFAYCNKIRGPRDPLSEHRITLDAIGPVSQLNSCRKSIGQVLYYGFQIRYLKKFKNLIFSTF